jgi:hypothetical protein
MNIVVNIDPKIKSINIDEDSITAFLEDGRIISVPLAWSWRLSNANESQRQNYIISKNGLGIHWPEIDEDLSAKGFLYGIPARHPKNPKILSA